MTPIHSSGLSPSTPQYQLGKSSGNSLDKRTTFSRISGQAPRPLRTPCPAPPSTPCTRELALRRPGRHRARPSDWWHGSTRK